MYYNTQLETPFTCIIAGASGSGKTTLMHNILRNKEGLFRVPPAKVFVYYSINQPIYDSWIRTGLVSEKQEGVPPLEELIEKIEPYKDIGGTCIVIDDQLHDINEQIEKIFTQVSHHYNCSVFFMTQNIFFRNARYRTMSLNTKYTFVMKYTKDIDQVELYAKRHSQYQMDFIMRSYMRATRNPYSYLLFDFSQSCPDIIRLRSSLFPHEFPMITYVEGQVSRKKRKYLY